MPSQWRGSLSQARKFLLRGQNIIYRKFKKLHQYSQIYWRCFIMSISFFPFFFLVSYLYVVSGRVKYILLLLFYWRISFSVYLWVCLYWRRWSQRRGFKPMVIKLTLLHGISNTLSLLSFISMFPSLCVTEIVLIKI